MAHKHKLGGDRLYIQKYSYFVNSTDLMYGVGSRNSVRGTWRGKLRSRSWDAYRNVRVGQIASAGGAKLRLPKARSFSIATREAQETEAILSIFMPKLGTFRDLVPVGFLTIKSKK